MLREGDRGQSTRSFLPSGFSVFVRYVHGPSFDGGRRGRLQFSNLTIQLVLAALRQQIAALLDPPRGDAGVIPTGISSLDAALSGGGVPRGRLTEVIGPRGSGKTTLVRELAAAAIAARRWVAYVDASRTLSPRDWAALGASGLLWVVRPKEATRGTWCADVLLRSGAFGLVVLDGAPAVSREVAVRLTRLAQESDAAFVLMQDTEDRTRGQVVGSAVRLRVSERADGEGESELEGGRGRGRSGRRGCSTARAITVVIEKGGEFRSLEVSCVIDVARRLCAHSEVPDRRGVALRNRRGERAGDDVPGARRPVAAGAGKGKTGSRKRNPPSGPAGTSSGGIETPGTTPVPSGSTLAHKRRCAEPVVRRDAFLLADPEKGKRGKGRGGRGGRGARTRVALGRPAAGGC